MTSRVTRTLLLAVGLMATLVAPLTAQGHALVLFAGVGRVVPAVHLSSARDGMTSAFAAGGGLALQFSPSSALRLSVARLKAELRDTVMATASPMVSRTYLAADLQMGFPGATATVPYVVLGGGAVITSPTDTQLARTASAAGRVGAGINLLTRPLALFLEGDAWVYRFQAYGFDRVQLDLELRTGVALALGW